MKLLTGLVSRLPISGSVARRCISPKRTVNTIAALFMGTAVLCLAASSAQASGRGGFIWGVAHSHEYFKVNADMLALKGILNAPDAPDEIILLEAARLSEDAVAFTDSLTAALGDPAVVENMSLEELNAVAAMNDTLKANVYALLDQAMQQYPQLQVQLTDQKKAIQDGDAALQGQLTYLRQQLETN